MEICDKSNDVGLMYFEHVFHFVKKVFWSACFACSFRFQTSSHFHSFKLVFGVKSVPLIYGRVYEVYKMVWLSFSWIVISLWLNRVDMSPLYCNWFDSVFCRRFYLKCTCTHTIQMKTNISQLKNYTIKLRVKTNKIIMEIKMKKEKNQHNIVHSV